MSASVLTVVPELIIDVLGLFKKYRRYRYDDPMVENKAPLKLLLEPDEYPCTWFVAGRDGVVSEYAGSLDLRSDRQPVGSMYGDIPDVTAISDGASGTDFPQIVKLPHLRGRLANGYDVDLAEVSFYFGFPTNVHISAASATVGVPQDETGFNGNPSSVSQDEGSSALQSLVPTYWRLSVQVGALDAVSGAAPLSQWSAPRANQGRHLEGEWTVSGNPDSTQKWSDGDVTMLLEYVASIRSGDPYAFMFAASPVMRIESREGLTVDDWVHRWVDPLRRIVSIATGDSQPLTYIAVEGKDVDLPPTRPRQYRQVYGSGITQEPYQSQHASVVKSSASVRVASDGLSLLAMLNRWQELEDEHHPLIETYGAMLAATEEHPRSRFLLLVQALEGLYGHETMTEYAERQERHTAEREDLIRVLRTTDALSPTQLKFLNRNLVKRPLRGLNEALGRLVSDLPVDLTPRLSGCKLLAEYLDDFEGAELQRVAYALSRVRNDLAHGNRGFDAYDLHETVQVLERIVRAHALRLLGCPEPVLERVCKGGP